MIDTMTNTGEETTARETQVSERTVNTQAAWDPFQLMDRLDEEALRRELEGVPSEELVYVVKEGGHEVVGLSKTGVDECCRLLVAQGQVIREEDLSYEVVGEGEDREALFKARASRYAISPLGQEVRLDQVIGVKRQPLYFEPASLGLDAKVPSKKYKGHTYRDLLGTVEGREYLGWMAENFKEPEIRDFVRRILEGEAVVAERGPQLNPHWFEHGAMKAARNARFRLIPIAVRAQVIATARETGRALTIEKQPGQRTPSPVLESRVPAPASAAAPTDRQVAFFQRLIASPVFTEDERRRGLEWLASRATRQTIKDQIDWLKHQVETR